MKSETFYKISYGLYVVGTRKNYKINAQITNTVVQIASDPRAISVAINKKNLTHDYLLSSKVMSASILEQDTPMKFIGNFGFKSGRDIDKFEKVQYKTVKTGAPIVMDYSIGFIEAEITNIIDVGSHSLFIAKAVNADMIKDGQPLTYAYYHDVMKGKSPKNAPVPQIEEHSTKNTKEESKMQKYKCEICGYIYDPEKGDPDSGIEPGTSFEDIPDDWECPVCGAGKEDFTAVDE